MTFLKFYLFALATTIALFLIVPAQAQECLSRPTIQQRLLPLIEPVREALTAVAVGRGDVDAAKIKLALAYGLIDRWQDAPPGVDGCRKQVK